MKILICRETSETGQVGFVVYDTDIMKAEVFSFSELAALIVQKKIYNAKLENSVIKTTDARHNIIKLDRDESRRPSAYYILDMYTSKMGSNIYVAVDNKGNLYEFSENLTQEFLKNRRIANASHGKGGLDVIKVPTFNTVLQKSLAHTSIK
ncbi:MAG: hypothetical protein II936_06255 [Oscillospiraceae bacterium]|nr:hypothetical protein [Oscillospiraceae bacterium]